MASVRVYELAKELNMNSKDLMTALSDMGVEVKSHASALDDKTVDQLKSVLKNNGKGSEKQAEEKVDPTPQAPAPQETKPAIELPAQVTVRNLAELLNVPTAEIQKALVKQGALVAVNQVVPTELSKKVVESLGYTVTVAPPPAPKVAPPAPEKPAAAAAPAPVQQKPKPAPAPAPHVKPKPQRVAHLVPRPPIVTILGHVDHGKTTLLDAIRQSNVVDQEFGGITQHIGAYQVDVKGRKITFLDTPGHEAFTAMRARGAQVTDIAILIVAADDGVMPQTIEAIDHAKAAGVQIIAAINKIDKPGANVDRTKQQLAEHGLVIEEWGGDIVSVDLSAKEKKNLDDLLEMILLVAELGEHKADPGAPVEATVVEAQLDKGKGPVATVLIKDGTLQSGDVVVVGQSFGRIKAMLDDRGHRVQKAGPATPVEIVGLSSVPQAGDFLEVVPDERQARQIAESRAAENREAKLATTQRVTLADLYKQLREGVVKDLNVILKTDVQGSVEAIRQSMDKLGTDEVRVNLIHSGVGNISESDILLASASNAVVVGFNVKVDPQASRMAEKEGIDVRVYKVIYELLDDVQGAMLGLLAPVLEETILGHAEVRQLFKLPRGGMVAGSYVTDGKIQRGADARVSRDGQVVYTGRISSLRHIKEDVREMAAGFECGIIVEGFADIQTGDIVEAYTVQEVARAR